jgi:hypothetical protein
MKRTLVVAALAALALAPAAHGKEVRQAQVCGPDGCITVDDQTAGAALANGGPPRTPPTAAPFYRIRIAIDTGGGRTDHFSVAAVPARHAMRGSDGTWMDMPDEVAAVIERVAGSARPYPAARLAGAAPLAPAPAEPSKAARADSLLWPEGVLLALALLGAAGLLVRRAIRGTGRFGHASS